MTYPWYNTKVKVYSKGGTDILDSGKNALVTAASIQMRAEIVSYGNNTLKGALYSVFLSTPFEFVSLIQMIYKMEAIFDTHGFPEAFMTPRTFGIAKNNKKKHELDGSKEMKDMMNSKIQFEPGGSKCTFEITVRFRQNATWQGQIIWAERNLKQNFRSVLEMLKLMDEAVSDSEGKSDSIEWSNNE